MAKGTSGEISMREVFEPRDQRFQPRAPFGERQLAQVLAVLDQQIIGAQMRGKFRQQLRVDGLAVEPLLQHVERLHAAVAQDQQFAVDRAIEMQRIDQDRETRRKYPRRCANRAARRACRRASPATACTRMPSHFHSAVKSAGSSAAKSCSSIACASITGRNGAGSLLTGFSARPSIQANSVDVGRREPGPHQLDLVGLLARRAPRPRSWQAAPRRRCAARR